MSQRFFRCRLCGLPHDVDTQVCPLKGEPIPPGPSILPAARPSQRPPVPRPSQRPPAPVATHEGSDEQAIPLIPRPPRAPSVAPPRASSRPPAPKADAAPVPSAPLEQPALAPAPRRSEMPPATLVGQVIDGRYEVRGILAEGGMGIVYDGVHIGLGRPVAIKALARRFTEDQVAVSRFLNEARVAGSLGHPNIVEVFDLGTLATGAPYLVMERLDGETLGHRLKREKTLSIADTVHIMRQILSALAATHQRAIIHRDLKPENVFLSRLTGLQPLVKLLDYGISKDLAVSRDKIGLTRVGFVMGTPTYMAPEQARGERTLDGRVDLYAVGALAYEMLVGRPPYQAKSPTALVAEMRRSPAVSPRSLRSTISTKLDLVVLTLLALDRRQRYASAQDALEALSDPTIARPDVPDEEPTVRTTAAAVDEPRSDEVHIFARYEKPQS